MSLRVHQLSLAWRELAPSFIKNPLYKQNCWSSLSLHGLETLLYIFLQLKVDCSICAFDVQILLGCGIGNRCSNRWICTSRPQYSIINCCSTKTKSITSWSCKSTKRIDLFFGNPYGSSEIVITARFIGRSGLLVTKSKGIKNIPILFWVVPHVGLSVLHQHHSSLMPINNWVLEIGWYIHQSSVFLTSNKGTAQSSIHSHTTNLHICTHTVFFDKYLKLQYFMREAIHLQPPPIICPVFKSQKTQNNE